MDFIKKNIANLITTIRIVLSFVLISLVSMSRPFIILYSISGLTDVLDGLVARKLNIVSKFGTILDSLADLLFYSVMILKLWTMLHEVYPLYIWIIFWVIIGLRLFLYIYVAYNHKEMLSSHTIFNKVTSFMIFLLPYTLLIKYTIIYCLILEAVAIVAVIYDFKLVGEKNETR